MPMWYPAGAKAEHLAVLTHAGMFDTSHMCVVMVRGTDALGLLQHCFSKNLEACVGTPARPLEPGRSVYGVFLGPAGEVIDDAIVFRLESDHFMVVVNSGMGAAISEHLKAQAGRRKAAVSDLSDAVGKLDVQGPAAARILRRVLRRPDKIFDHLPYFAFKGHFDPESPLGTEVQLTDETPVLLSRTGYTGEFGFELFCPPERFVSLWETLLSAGQDLGLIPCGLAARDSLRTGAVLPLSHQDIGPWPFLNNPWPFALPYSEDGQGFSKRFLGDTALKEADYGEHTLPFAGFDLRKVSTAGPAVVLDEEERQIGSVLTCATDMAIGRAMGRILSINSPGLPRDFAPRGLSCGFVRVSRPIEAGKPITLKDNLRRITVEVVRDIRPDRTARQPLKRFL
jgi:aminomethyltransferase